MEIDRQNSALSLDTVLRSTQENMTPPRTDDASGGGKGSDKVVLSPRAREIREATQELTRDASVNDMEKVQALRQRVDAGTYEVKAGRVAMAMITESILDQTA